MKKRSLQTIGARLENNMNGRVKLLAVTLAVAAFSVWLASAAERPAGGESGEPPAVEVLEAERPFWESAQKFLDAYAARDPEALGMLFTADAEIQDEFGELTVGRDAVQIGRNRTRQGDKSTS
jgi:hypothetical protein